MNYINLGTLEAGKETEIVSHIQKGNYTVTTNKRGIVYCKVIKHNNIYAIIELPCQANIS